MLVAGLIGGFIAAIPGWIDWAAIPSGTRAKRVGLLHGVGNVIVLVLFTMSWVFWRDEPDYLPPTLSTALSIAGFMLAGFTGWLGGELVDRLGVGVDNDAHLNAPNSLTGRSATNVRRRVGHVQNAHGRQGFA